jgi:hypothetical protein
MPIAWQRRHFGRFFQAARAVAHLGMPMLAVATCGAFAMMLLVDDGSAQAVDTGSQNNLRIAAVGGDAGRMGGEAKSLPTFAKVSDDSAAVDLRTLLAQYAPAAPAEAQARRDTVLLTIPLPAPAGVEDDIAREHGVEIIDSTDMPEFNWRSVMVRLPPGRPIDAVVAALKRDQRIKFAHATGTYRPVNVDSQTKAPDHKLAPKQDTVPPSIHSYGVAAPQESGGMAKAAAPAVRKALAPKTQKASTSGMTASVQRITGEELFVGADGRLR